VVNGAVNATAKPVAVNAYGDGASDAKPKQVAQAIDATSSRYAYEARARRDLSDSILAPSDGDVNHLDLARRGNFNTESYDRITDNGFLTVAPESAVHVFDRRRYRVLLQRAALHQRAEPASAEGCGADRGDGQLLSVLLSGA
jgi:hypothetical protein